MPYENQIVRISANVVPSGLPFSVSADALRRSPAPFPVPIQGTKASNTYLKSTSHKPEIRGRRSVQNDSERLRLRLLTWRHTGATLRPMDVRHVGGRHSAV